MRRRRLFILILLAVSVGCSGASAAAPRPTGTWVGSVSLAAGAQPVALSVEVRGGRAVVAVGGGHPSRTEVGVRATAGRLRLSLPGRPAPLTIDLRAKGARLVGTARQGVARGTASLHRGAALEAATNGLYALGGDRFVASFDVPGQRTALLLDAGETHVLTRTGHGRYAIGAGLSERTPTVGEATFAATAATWRGEPATRVALRQEEVRLAGPGGPLACTLTIPPGSGRRPAIAFAHGAGPALRSWTSFSAAHFHRLGIVTLSCDKRGIGWSGGRYPGEFASTEGIDAYARDVEAQARFLASQPEVDPARIGVSGGSQAGWIMPLAASRERAIRFVVGLVSPTTTQGETDLWSNLAGQGQTPPNRSDDAMLAEVRAAGPSGFAPMPSIRSLTIAALWLYGGADRTVPTRLCVERLEPLTKEPGRDFSYAVFPGGDHGLVLTANGLLAEQARSDRFVPGLFTTIAAWLRARGLTAA